MAKLIAHWRPALSRHHRSGRIGHSSTSPLIVSALLVAAIEPLVATMSPLAYRDITATVVVLVGGQVTAPGEETEEVAAEPTVELS